MIKIRCPICEREMEVESKAEWPLYPFCSKRCKTIDLGRWLDGRYGLPKEEDVEEDLQADEEQELP